MSTFVDLLAGILPDSQKAAIALSLAADIENPAKAPALSELIGQLDEETVNEILPTIEKYCLKSICSGDEEQIKCAVKFAKRSEAAQNTILERVLRLLKRSSGGISVLQDREEHASDEDESSEPLEKEDLFHLMDFLFHFSVGIDLKASALAHTVDTVFLTFLGHPEDEIARQCSKTIRWRVEAMAKCACQDTAFAEYLWGTVFNLLQPSSTKQHTRNGYVLWLRMLGAKDVSYFHNSYFQESVVCQVKYWKTLQHGLAGASHEVRKFCLSILQLSLKSISRSFQTEVLTWDMDQMEPLLDEWSTFTTLYEIVGIDTSLHQTQGAQNEILDLFTDQSKIHPSWGFCLLCTGFQSSMDSVRKYSAQLLLSIKPEDLHNFQYGLPFLKHTFLPYMLQSSHFTVRRKGPFTNEISCEYGVKLADFLTNLFHSLKTPEELNVVSSAVIETLVDIRESFDAVKVYTAWGLVRGLEGKRSLIYHDHVDSIISLFENFSEGELFRRAFQTLVLKLILCFKFDNLEQFCGLVGKFISFHGSSIVCSSADLLRAHLHASGYDEDQLIEYLESCEISTDSAVLLYLLIMGSNAEEEVNAILQNSKDTVILALARFDIPSGKSSALDSRIQDIVQRALTGEDSQEIYSDITSIALSKERVPKTASTKDLWNSMRADFQSDTFEQLFLALDKLTMINNVLPWTQDQVSLEDVKATQEIMFKNSNALKSRVEYYKLKDDAFGQIHVLLQHIVSSRSQELTGSEVVSQFRLGCTHSITLEAICKTTMTLLETKLIDQESITAVIFGLCESWEEISNERLKLSEKEMQWAVIDFMFHPEILKKAAEEEFVNDAIKAFAQSVVENSYGRRGLTPHMMKRISEFQCLDQTTFEKLRFVPEILAHVACHRQVSAHAFRMETVIGTLYDEHIAPVGNIYEQQYGPEEVSGKIWLFSVVNSIRTEEFATRVVDSILNEEDTFRMVHITKQTDGAEEYVRCQLAKVILSVINCISIETVQEKYFDQFNYFIENDPSPLVRIYFEWIIAIQLHKNHELCEIYFKKVANSLESHEIKPTVVTIYERILYLMIQSLDRDLETEYLTRLLTIIIPAASTNKAITRHFSMSLSTSVHEEIKRKNLPLNSELVALVGNMYKSAIASSAFGQYRSGDALLWDIIKDMDLISISGGLLLRLSDREVEFITKEQFSKYLTPEQVAILNHPIGDDRVELWVAKIKADLKASRELEEATSIAQMPLQTKSGAWSAVMDVDESDKNDVKRSDLIVVASLVTKAPNLGGICRLCDVLGAGIMTVFDMKMTKNPAFKSVAVTADYWMPMKEVLPWDIRDYLRAMKVEGYTLIGLEQTDKSVVLNSELKFPKKSLVLLGREKEGIPGELLAELDFCVEIKQVGVIRSMNIQTATAVICHAYSSQHC